MIVCEDEADSYKVNFYSGKEYVITHSKTFWAASSIRIGKIFVILFVLLSFVEGYNVRK